MAKAIDLDGTLARYDGWKGIEHIGDPIPVMYARVRDWIRSGEKCYLFTARITDCQPMPRSPIK